MQKFYRVSGGSTQLKGVVSDIVLPTQIEALKLREKDNEYALPYDEISKANYKPWGSAYSINTIKQMSDSRLASDSAFRIIKNNTEWLATQTEKSNPLNIDEYRKEKQLIKARSEQVNNVMKLEQKLSVSLLPQEKDIYKEDVARKDRTNQWLKGMSEDIYLNQAVKVVKDMIGLDNLAKAEVKP